MHGKGCVVWFSFLSPAIEVTIYPCMYDAYVCMYVYMKTCTSMPTVWGGGFVPSDLLSRTNDSSTIFDDSFSGPS